MKTVLNVAKGVFAILFWIGCFAFVSWYNTSEGYSTYWKYVPLIAASLTVIAGISQTFRNFLSTYASRVVEYAFNIYEEKTEWVMWFVLGLIYVAIVYVILAAPFGILCHVGWKSCGKW
jgi:hypothetical protein